MPFNLNMEEFTDVLDEFYAAERAWTDERYDQHFHKIVPAQIPGLPSRQFMFEAGPDELRLVAERFFGEETVRGEYCRRWFAEFDKMSPMSEDDLLKLACYAPLVLQYVSHLRIRVGLMTMMALELLPGLGYISNHIINNFCKI